VETSLSFKKVQWLNTLLGGNYKKETSALKQESPTEWIAKTRVDGPEGGGGEKNSLKFYSSRGGVGAWSFWYSCSGKFTCMRGKKRGLGGVGKFA